MRQHSHDSGAATIAVLVDVDIAEARAERLDLEAAAQAAGQRLFVVEITADRDLEPAFASMVEQKAGALFIGAGAYFAARRRLLAALALRHRLPAAHAQREFVVAGGLMCYGTSMTDAYRQGGSYAGRILKGELPADFAGAASHQVRIRDQSGNREGARPFRANAHSRRRRRGD